MKKLNGETQVSLQKYVVRICVGEDSWESLRTARRSNQSILKEISPEYSLEGLRLKVKFQYFGNLMAKNWLIRKDPDAGKDWRQEEKRVTEDEMVGWHHWLDGHEFEQALGVVKDREARRAADHGVAKSWTQLSNWTATTIPCVSLFLIVQNKTSRI